MQLPIRTYPVTATCAVLFTLLALSGPAPASPPLDPKERAEVAGQPATIEAGPASVTLSGVHDARQMVVSGKYADGSVRDLTAVATARIEPADVAELQDGLFLRPKQNGTASLVIAAGGKEVRVPVTVAGMDQPSPVSFRRDVISAMNVGGCNAGACHGTPSGKNGFKLSLRGFDPAADYLQLTRDQFGRRTDKHHPEESLMLLKAVGRVPHEGGQRFGATSLPGEMMAAWLAGGLKDDPPTLAPVKKVE
ncbi:MAG TPA: hypothetical protein VKE74_02745, partial [Gemmataceae bacterium]|nr:hypothetical protein [Gemmataceae bacterium]